MTDDDLNFPATQAEPLDEPEQSTHERLRALEDEVLGEDHLRPHGKIERGVGSKFAGLPSTHKAHHAALEALIAAEAEHRKASAAEDAAHAKLEAAIDRAVETEEAMATDEPVAEPAETVDG